jgi:hypothetical protein
MSPRRAESWRAPVTHRCVTTTRSRSELVAQGPHPPQSPSSTPGAATMPSKAEAEKLDLPTGTPVAEHIRTGYDAECPERPGRHLVSSPARRATMLSVSVGRVGAASCHPRVSPGLPDRSSSHLWNHGETTFSPGPHHASTGECHYLPQTGSRWPTGMRARTV